MEALIELKSDLRRLAQFGSNISDAHSCLIFLPEACIAERIPTELPGSVNQERAQGLILGGFHSLSNDVQTACRFSHDSGLIGWVAKHRRSIHVSPFEHDSRTLGIYSQDHQLKSFIGTPILLSPITEGGPVSTGVIACDSKKSFAFSKLQGKLLEDLAHEVSRTVALTHRCMRQQTTQLSFGNFLTSAHRLGENLGLESTEILRLHAVNLDVLERDLGLGKAIELNGQIFRLIQQSLPPHTPVCRLPNGDIMLAVDNMLTPYIENKVRAICAHVAVNEKTIEFNFVKGASTSRKERVVTIERLIQQTCSDPLPDGRRADASRRGEIKGLDYEYRRA